MIIAGLRGPTGQQVVTVCPRWDPGLDQSEADGILIPTSQLFRILRWEGGGAGSVAQRTVTLQSIMHRTRSGHVTPAQPPSLRRFRSFRSIFKGL